MKQNHEPQTQSKDEFWYNIAGILIIYSIVIAIFVWALYALHSTPRIIQTDIEVMDTVHISEQSFIVKSVGKRSTKLDLITVAGFSPSVAEVQQAYTLINTDNDTAYCDERYTYKPLSGDQVTIRQMSGWIGKDTVQKDIWMQVSRVRPEHQHSSFHF